MKADVIVRLPFLTYQFHKADKHSDRKQDLEQFDWSKLKTKVDIKTNLRLVKTHILPLLEIVHFYKIIIISKMLYPSTNTTTRVYLYIHIPAT